VKAMLHIIPVIEDINDKYAPAMIASIPDFSEPTSSELILNH
jgi:hypothetical protein